jgi:hypothetical protein
VNSRLKQSEVGKPQEAKVDKIQACKEELDQVEG